MGGRSRARPLLVVLVLLAPFNMVSAGTTNFVTFSEITFSLRTSPGVLLGGVVLAVLTGPLGGLLSAWSARAPLAPPTPGGTRDGGA